MYFCQKCGAPCEPNDLFCAVCGADLKAQQPVSASQPFVQDTSSVRSEQQLSQDENSFYSDSQQNPGAFYQGEHPGVQPPSYQPPVSSQFQPVYQKPGQQPGDKRGLGIASLILGIISIVGCCIFFIGIPCAIAAIVLGILQIVKNKSKGLAIAGIILGGVGILLGIILVIAAATNGVTFTWNGEEYLWTL